MVYGGNLTGAQLFAMVSGLGDSLGKGYTAGRQYGAQGEAESLWSQLSGQVAQPGVMPAGGAPSASVGPVAAPAPAVASGPPRAGGLPRFAQIDTLGRGVGQKYDPAGEDRGQSLTEYVENGSVNGVDPEFQRRALAFLNDNPYGVGIRSGYRSTEQQQALWDKSDKSGRMVAPPGRSNHNHGAALDLSYESPEAKAWAQQNAAAYGLRFPMAYEPWHVEPAEARGMAYRAPASAAPASQAINQAAPTQVAQATQNDAAPSMPAAAPSVPQRPQIDPRLLMRMIANPAANAEQKQLAATLLQNIVTKGGIDAMALGKDQRLIDKRTGKVILDATEKENKYSTFQAPNGATYAFDPTDPSKVQLLTPPDAATGYTKTNDFKAGDVYKGPDGKPGVVGASGTTVNVGGEKSYDSEMGKSYAKKFQDFQDADGNARKMQNTLNVMEAAMSSPGFYSGAASREVLLAQRALKGLGFDVKPQANELFDKMSNEFVVNKLGGSLGNGVSNADVSFINGTVANRTNTPEGNKAIIGIARKLAERESQIAKMSRDYAKKNNGRIDAGFDEEVASFAEKNPLFQAQAQAQPKPATAAPKVGAVDSGYRFKGGNPADPNAWEKVN